MKISCKIETGRADPDMWLKEAIADGGAFQKVEGCSVALVTLLWILPFTGSIWGTNLRYHCFLEASGPVMVIVFISAMLTWPKYRRHVLVHIAVLLVWAMPGL